MISPQLVYYKEIIEDNIKKMITYAQGPQRLWPHVKTHKMADVIRLQMNYGIDRFKCATIAEAEMCGAAGAKKAALAYPLVGPNIPRFLTLAKTFPETEFFAVSDCTEQVKLAGAAAVKEHTEIQMLMDVDTGQHRTGVPMGQAAAVYKQWAQMPGICMRGLHCYDGHRHESDYEVRSREVAAVDKQIDQIKNDLAGSGMDCGIVILGGTPSFPCHQKLNRDYLSPGTCVIQDVGYQAAYPDLPFEPGAAVLTRVISIQGEDAFTLDMGTKAVASDPNPERAVLSGMEYAKTVLQNEEHWVVKIPAEHRENMPKVGDVMFAVPMHICPTSALYPSVPVIEKGKLSGWWEVTARNRKLSI